MDHDLVKLGAGGCLVFTFLAIACGGGTALLMRRRAASEAPRIAEPAEPSNDSPTPPQNRKQVAATPEPSMPSHDYTQERTWSRRVHVQDRAHVDLTELIPQAARVATELQPGAKFYMADGWGLHGGTIDLDHVSSETRAHFDFEFGGLDKSKPPGKDKVEVRIDVTLSGDGSELVARASTMGAIHIRTGDAMGGPLKTKVGCTSKRAFAAAVASGVPANAIARLIYDDNHHFSPQNPLVWSVRVEGHDEYRRELDAETCAMVKNWGDVRKHRR